VEEERGGTRSQEQAEGNTELGKGCAEMEGQHQEAEDEEEAGEVIALEEVEEAKREPIGKKVHDDERGDEDFEDSTPRRNSGSDCGVRAWFFFEHIAKKGAGDEQDADKSQETPENIGAQGKTRGFRQGKNHGSPSLAISGNGGREKHADMRVPRDDGELNGGIVRLRGKIGGVLDETGGFELANENAGIGEDVRYGVEKQVLMNEAVGRLHGRGGDSDDSGRAKFFGDAKSDGATHRVTREDGALGENHTASGETTDEGGAARFGLLGGERSWGTAVAREVRKVNAEAEFGEAAGDVLHNEVVCGNAVKKDDVARFGGL